MQNSTVSMTKEQYFDMCETLGTEPVAEQIPVEVDDLPLEVQEAFEVYRILRDDWDSIGGRYLGKSFIGIVDIFNLLEIPKQEHKGMLVLIRLIDSVRQSEINKKTE